MSTHYNSFADWFVGADGDFLRTHEQILLDTIVADIFGFNAVQIGLASVDLLRNSRIMHRYHVDLGVSADVRAEPTRLPFASQSLDLLVLPHALEFFLYPHQILREAERVLIPEGHLVISGFNAYSLWGLYHWYKRQRGEFDWHGQFVGLHRLYDWLSLLGCDPQVTRMCCFLPPLINTRWMSGLNWVDVSESPWWVKWGGVYMVHAVKRVHGMRLLMPEWDNKRQLSRVLRPASSAMQVERKDGNE